MKQLEQLAEQVFRTRLMRVAGGGVATAIVVSLGIVVVDYLGRPTSWHARGALSLATFLIWLTVATAVWVAARTKCRPIDIAQRWEQQAQDRTDTVSSAADFSHATDSTRTGPSGMTSDSVQLRNEVVKRAATPTGGVTLRHTWASPVDAHYRWPFAQHGPGRFDWDRLLATRGSHRGTTTSRPLVEPNLAATNQARS